MADQNPMTVQERNALIGGILSDALMDRLLGPTPSTMPGGDGTPIPVLMPAPLAVLAQQVWSSYQHRLMSAFIENVDLDALAEKVATNVAGELLKQPQAYWDTNRHADALRSRVLEIVAQTLGQRVVDQMDLQIGPKEVGA